MKVGDYVLVLDNEFHWHDIKVGNIYKVENIRHGEGILICNNCLMFHREVRKVSPLERQLYLAKERIKND